MSERLPGTKKAGRPLKKEAAGALSKILGFRLRPDLHAKLEEAAQLQRRSISEECERRLNLSFDHEAAVVQMFGHSAHRPLVLALSSVIRLVEAEGDENGDRLQAYAAAIALIEGLAGDKPSKDIKKEAADKGHQAFQAAASVLAVEAKTPLPTRVSLAQMMGR